MPLFANGTRFCLCLKPRPELPRTLLRLHLLLPTLLYIVLCLSLLARLPLLYAPPARRSYLRPLLLLVAAGLVCPHVWAEGPIQPHCVLRIESLRSVVVPDWRHPGCFLCVLFVSPSLGSILANPRLRALSSTPRETALRAGWSPAVVPKPVPSFPGSPYPAPFASGPRFLSLPPSGFLVLQAISVGLLLLVLTLPSTALLPPLLRPL